MEYLDIDLEYNGFGIDKKCEHCNQDIDVFYDQRSVMNLINKRSE